MTEQIKIDLKLDLKGLLCPLPIVKLSQAIKELPVGAVIEGVATDPGLWLMSQHGLNQQGKSLFQLNSKGRNTDF
jgi:tRNA 2-thiouridine synthesizing protein A